MVELYKDVAGEWRWRLVAANGKIIADSGEGYRRRGGAVKAWERVRTLAMEASVVEKLT